MPRTEIYSLDIYLVPYKTYISRKILDELELRRQELPFFQSKDFDINVIFNQRCGHFKIEIIDHKRQFRYIHPKCFETITQIDKSIQTALPILEDI